ncbi:MAG TPA: hypothetical protein EYG88_06000 [Desulfocapsa sulfexigens]|nr:hypothetical protein [Desulfocapsa sulfexigens]
MTDIHGNIVYDAGAYEYQYSEEQKALSNGFVKILHLLRCAPEGSALWVQKMNHFKVLQYAEMIQNLHPRA